MKKLITIFIICCLTLALVFSMASCGDNKDNKETQATQDTQSTDNNENTESEQNKETTCSHTWVDADCDTPKTCSICGATEGDALGHATEEDDGNCLTPIVCPRCNEVLTSGKTQHVAHADDGDCTTAITCSVCGTVTTPAKESHTGGTATCVDGKYCEVCGIEYDTATNPDNHDLTTVDDNNVCGCGQHLTFVISGSGVNTNYDNFADALAAWTDGTTLTLLADVTGLTERIKTYAKGLMLDLNGHKIECSDTLCTIWIDGDSGSELTICDGKGNGYIQGRVYAVTGGSKLCLESGTVETVTANGDFIMTGGQIICEDSQGLFVNSEVDVVISGGEIYGSTYGASITSGNVIITGTAKITGAGQYAIYASSYSEVVISGTPIISGAVGEFYLNGKITLNTQPADGKVWRVKIDKGVNSGIEDGVFAIPGEGVTLDASKFASAMDGYEVKKNDKGELLLCNHAVSYYAVANGDGTHNMTCWCGGTVLETNLACSGGMATDTLLALCQYCGVAYGELDPNVHYDIYTANMTEEELQTALTELLLAGQTEISIFLTDADAKMLAAIDAALNSSGVDKDNVKLTFGSQNAVQNENQLITALRKGGIITLMADITLTDTTDVKKNTTIALNGYTLTPGGLGLNVEEGCTMTVIGDGAVNEDDGLWVFDGVLNLHGGTIEWLYVCETSSTANIFDGKITTLTVDYGSTVNIFGGYVGALDYWEGTLIITGGTFGFDPSAYLAEGYIATEAEGKWTVTKTN